MKRREFIAGLLLSACSDDLLIRKTEMRPFGFMLGVRTPSAFDDIWGWWRADELTGTAGSYQLTDKSGNGRHMLQGAGTLTPGIAANGKAKLTGNATARLHNAATLESWPITVFTVGKRTNNNTCGFFGHTDGGGPGYNTLWYGFEPSNQFSVYNMNRTNNVDNGAGLDQCWMMRIGYGARISAVNGILQVDQIAASIVRSTAIAVSIGSYYRGLNFDFQDQLVWNRVLSLDEIDEVHTYINNYYSMSLPLWSSYTSVPTIWMGGQSNASGRGLRGGSDANIPVAYRGAQANVKIFTDNGTIDTYNLSSNKHMFGDNPTLAATYTGCDVVMCKDYADRIGDTVYLYKCAEGSTSMSADVGGNGFWDVYDNSLTQGNTRRLFWYNVNYWWWTLRFHQAAGRKPDLKAMFWYQGEEDATNVTYAGQYAAKGAILFSELTKELGVTPRKRFIARINANIDIGQHPYRDTVRTQQNSLITNLGATLVDTDGYTLSDLAHININGQLNMGAVVAAAI